MNVCARQKSCGSNPRQRKMIWEVAANLHCTVCGTCMNIAEQRKLLKKLDIAAKEYRDYEIHSIFVNSLSWENKLSRMVHSYLDRKYRHELNLYELLPESELETAWREKTENGDICGLFWVMLSRNDISDELLYLVTGEVHMMSHLNGGLCRYERMQLKQAETEKQKLKLRLRENKKMERKRAAELEKAKACIGKLEKQVQELQNKCSICVETAAYQQMLTALEKENAELHQELNENSNSLQEYKKHYRLMKKDKEALEQKLRHQKNTIIQLCREINTLPGCENGCVETGRPDEKTADNKGKLLLVGGNYGLNSYYRNIIEEMGWEYRYHDGCLNGGSQSLIEKMKSSDLILCSLDINSHGAVNCVKEYACRFKKEYRLLEKSSLSSIARVLAEQPGA